MARKGAQNGGNDPLDHDDDAVELVPVNRLPPPEAVMPPPSTDAERRTEDMWERLLGSDEVGTGYVNISRVMGAGNTTEDFVQRVPADQYDYDGLLEHLRENYGPGAYRIRLYVMGSSGRYALRGNRLATIAKPIGNAVAPAIREAARNGQDMPAILATFEAMQQRSQQQMADLIDRIERRNASPSRSPALEMAETMQAMMTAMAPMFAMLKGGQQQQADPLDTLTKLLAIQKQLQPGAIDTAPTNWADVVAEGFKALPAVLGARNEQVRRALPHHAPPAAARKPLAPTFDPLDSPANPANWAGAAEATPEDEAIEVVAVDRSLGNRLHPLHDNLCDLLNAARSFDATGEPTPDAVAESVVANMPEAQRAPFRAFLESPSLARDLFDIHPEAIDAMEWLLAMRDSVIDRLDLIEGVNGGYDQGDESPEALEAHVDDSGTEGQADQARTTA